MKKQNSIFSVRVMCEVAIFAAIGYVLDFLQGAYSDFFLPNGGSLGIAMLPIFIVAYRRGFLPALLTGIVMALLDIFDGFYVLSTSWYLMLIQVLLDYGLAYPLCAFAGVFTKEVRESKTTHKRILFSLLGVLLGSGLKFLSHFLAGAIFWGDDPKSFAWGLEWMNKWTYSLIYNGSYVFGSMLICGLIIAIIAWKWPFIFTLQKQSEEKKEGCFVDENTNKGVDQ